MAFGGGLQRLSQKAGGQLSHALPGAGGAKRVYERGQADGGASRFGKEGEDVGLILLMVFVIVLVCLCDEVNEKNGECSKEENDDEV